ncbi:uncharacterized protein CCOS01_12764 [Colletotrichum costaricense]|uniref:Uncharacterized protein n=1 Tax=Colletotrichum costaricense TaxID=1209916 RepID=A0AAI9YNG3_9PEZI|nr:uncharacterized protein CCOS01_12764 [Colletotrichum costaricense]KAK1517215.1 hypothetical protein CCOS01_12764 [Colletotrichum costaricense]
MAQVFTAVMRGVVAMAQLAWVVMVVMGPTVSRAQVFTGMSPVKTEATQRHGREDQGHISRRDGARNDHQGNRTYCHLLSPGVPLGREAPIGLFQAEKSCDEDENNGITSAEYAPPYKRRAVAVAAGSLSHFFIETEGLSRVQGLYNSNPTRLHRLRTRYPLVQPTVLPPPGPGGRAIAEFLSKHGTPTIQSKVAEPGSRVRDFIKSGDQQDIENRKHVLFYEKPPTARELRAWAEWDKNLPIMQAKFEEWEQLATVRRPRRISQRHTSFPFPDLPSELESDGDAETESDIEMEDVTEEDSEAASEDEDEGVQG